MRRLALSWSRPCNPGGDIRSQKDYWLSASVSAFALAGVAAGASVPLDSPRFSEVADSVGMSGALDTVVL